MAVQAAASAAALTSSSGLQADSARTDTMDAEANKILILDNISEKP
jgi:Flp pilus assembly protein TadG